MFFNKHNFQEGFMTFLTFCICFHTSKRRNKWNKIREHKSILYDMEQAEADKHKVKSFKHEMLLTFNFCMVNIWYICIYSLFFCFLVGLTPSSSESLWWGIYDNSFHSVIHSISVYVCKSYVMYLFHEINFYCLINSAWFFNINI